MISSRNVCCEPSAYLVQINLKLVGIKLSRNYEQRTFSDLWKTKFLFPLWIDLKGLKCFAFWSIGSCSISSFDEILLNFHFKQDISRLKWKFISISISDDSEHKSIHSLDRRTIWTFSVIVDKIGKELDQLCSKKGKYIKSPYWSCAPLLFPISSNTWFSIPQSYDKIQL